MPDMNMVITTVGINYLSATRLASGLGQFSGFVLGSSNAGVIDNSSTTVLGTPVYFGTVSQMNFAKVNDHEVTIRCVLEDTVGDFPIGSFGLLCDGIPFFLGRLEYIHTKQKTVGEKVGGRFTLQVRFLMLDIHDNWSFSNMLEYYVQFNDENVNYNTAPQTPVESADQMLQCDTIPALQGRKGYALYPSSRGLRWRAPDLQMKDTDVTLWRVDGGTDGDDHTYAE